MTLPVTISGISTACNLVGPYKASDGSYWFFGRDSSTATTLQAFKATGDDPTNAWATGANLTGFSTAILYLAADQNGDTIHLAVLDGTSGTSVNVKYVTFAMTTATFGSVETIASALNNTNNSGVAANFCSIVYGTTNNQPVVFFNGARIQVSSTYYTRVYFSNRTGSNSWAAATEVDDNRSNDAVGCSAVMGNSGYIHFNWLYRANSSAVRSLNSSNTLQTAATSSDGQVPLQAVMNGSGVVCTSGVGFWTGTISKQTYYFTSAQNPTLSRDGTPPDGHNAIFYESSSGRFYLLSATNSTTLQLQYSTDGNSWTTVSSIFTGTSFSTSAILFATCGRIYGKTVGAVTTNVLPYIVNDNGTLKYNEYTLSSSGTVQNPIPYETIQSGTPSDFTKEAGTFTAQIVADSTTNYTDRILNTSALTTAGDLTWRPAGLGTFTDCETLQLVKISGSVANGNYLCCAGVRLQAGADSGYCVVFEANGTSGGSYVSTGRLTTGTLYRFSGASFTWSTNTWYWVRSNWTSNSGKFKVWALGSAEPGSWTRTDSDSNYASGYVGCRFDTAAGKQQYASITLGVGTSTAPFPALGATPELLDADTTLRVDASVSHYVADADAKFTGDGLCKADASVLHYVADAAAKFTGAGGFAGNASVVHAVLDGAAKFTGSGSFAGDASITHAVLDGAAKFTGAGSFAGDASVVHAVLDGAAKFTGAGGFAGDAGQIIHYVADAAAKFTGAGGFAGDAGQIIHYVADAAAKFTGAGGFAGDAGQIIHYVADAAARFDGDGSLGVDAGVIHAALDGAAKFTGVGVVGLDAAVLHYVADAAALLAGAGSFAGDITKGVVQQAAASFSAIGSLQANAEKGTLWQGAALISGAGDFSADAAVSHYQAPGDTLLAGAGNFAADASVVHYVADGAALLSGAGNLALDAVISHYQAQGAGLFAAVGDFAADAEVVHYVADGAALLAGAGQLTAIPSGTIPAEARLDGAGSLEVWTFGTWQIAGALVGAGGFLVNATITHYVADGAAEFDATGNFVVDVTLVHYLADGAAKLTGAGGFTADASITHYIADAAALLAGAGSLPVAAVHTPDGAAEFDAAGDFIADARFAFYGNSLFDGQGNFAADASIVHAQWPAAAKFDGAGALASHIAKLPIDIRQDHFRFRTDANVVDGTPTWAADEDGNFYPADSPFRLRVLVVNDGEKPLDAGPWQIAVSKNGGPYQLVTVSSIFGVRSYDAGASNDEAPISTSLLSPPP